MAPEQERNGLAEASRLSRRQYVLTAGVLASGVLPVTGTGAAATTANAEVRAPTVDHAWNSVAVSGDYADPVVLAPALSYRGTNPASPRVRNVDGEGFDLRVEEWDYLDGAHLPETVGCFVAEAGAHTPADGPAFEVTTVRTDHRWAPVSFSSSFSEAPLAFSNAQTRNGTHPIVTRNRNVEGSGMELRVQEEEAEGLHLEERVGVLAIEPGTGTLNGRAFEADSIDDVDSRWRTVSFAGAYQDPVFLADMQTHRGSNTATVRYRNLTESSVEVRVEEERSADDEVRHIGERVGYLVFEGASESDGGYGLGGFGEGGFGQ